MATGLLLSTKDLMKLTGSTSYQSVLQPHRAIRESMGKGKRKLTIGEYCKFEIIEYTYVCSYLQGKEKKVSGGIFLSVKDLMRITGSESYESCRQTHQALRDSSGSEKRKLTVKEYCDLEQIDFDETVKFLNREGLLTS